MQAKALLTALLIQIFVDMIALFEAGTQDTVHDMIALCEASTQDTIYSNHMISCSSSDTSRHH